MSKIKVHVLHCGTITVSESVPYGNKIDLLNTGRQLFDSDRKRITLPVCCYLIEHPHGLLLVDAGWCRGVSPNGIFDRKAAEKLLPGYLVNFYHPVLPAGAAIHEQLEERGLRAEDLDLVMLTHLDPDHVAGVQHITGAKRIILPEDEYFWACRTVYRARQPWSLWMDYPIERVYYRGSPLGSNRWAIDVFGDESVMMVNLPGHTDGMAAVLLRNGGRFLLLAADAAFSPRNWEEGITPGFGMFRDRQLASLRWVGQMAAEPGCVGVLCSHDPAVAPQTILF